MNKWIWIVIVILLVIGGLSLFDGGNYVDDFGRDTEDLDGNDGLDGSGSIDEIPDEEFVDLDALDDVFDEIDSSLDSF